MPAVASHRKQLVSRLNQRARRTTERVRALGEIAMGQGLSVARYELGNGLRILVQRDPSAPVFSYHTWYRVGSKHEKPGKTGLSHLFEHLMFNETRRLRKGALDKLIESAGGETNASTWVDWTHYHSELPSTELPLIARIEADRMQHLVLRDPQVASEKEVVANERRYRVDDDIEGELAELLYATAFTRHPYGIPTIGWMADIEGFTTADCRHFYATYYAPNNATLVVVGDVDEEQLLRIVQQRYGRIPASRIPPLKATKEPVQRRERVKQLARPTPTAKVVLAYHAPSFRDPDFVPLSLASDLLFGGRSSRLHRKLVVDHELVTDVHGSAAPFAEPGLFEIWASLRPKREIAPALRVIDRELQRLCDVPVGARELQKVKNRAELGFLQGLETAGGRAEQIGFFEVVYGDAAGLLDRLHALRAVTPRDIQRVARRYLRAHRRTRIEVVPSGGAGA